MKKLTTEDFILKAKEVHGDKGGQLQFEKQQIRDNNLRSYCKNNNIKLLEIKYDTKFEHIPELINNFIKND